MGAKRNSSTDTIYVNLRPNYISPRVRVKYMEWIAIQFAGHIDDDRQYGTLT